MTKHLSPSEFAEYVDNLNFEELEDVTAFVKSYYEAYESTPSENVDEKNDAWVKYVILTSRFCMTFLTYIEMAFELRKKYEDLLKDDG
jgi:hypothetical protein